MIIIDQSHLLYRHIYMNKDKVIENPEFIAHSLLTSIVYNADRFGASRSNPVLMAMDSTSWRKDFYTKNSVNFIEYKNETYKGRRTKDDSIPWVKIFEVYDDVMQSIKQYSDFHVLKVDNAEADDIIAVATQYYKSKGHTIYIVSSDKDFLQLQDEPKVNIYDPIKDIFRPTIDTERYKKIHTILGDSSDNILPIKARLGEKTAEKILLELDVLLQTNPAMKERYNFNRTLVDFEYIPIEISNDIIAELEKQEHSYNSMKLINEFKRYRLVKIIENINKFKLKNEEVKTKLNTHFSNKTSINNIQLNSLENFFND